MGKTKTAFVGGVDETTLTGEDKYKQKQKKKSDAQAQKAKAEVGSKEKVRIPGLGGGQRIVAVTAEPLSEIDKSEQKENIKETQKVQKPKERKRGAKYIKAKTQVDRNKLYSIDDAVKLIKQTSYSKFNGTVELHLAVRKVGLSTSVSLPHWAGKEKKIEIADDKTLDKLKNGKVDFDVLLATTDMMPKLIPFAKLLGPKGLMPNPKKGTIIKTKKDAEKFSGNTQTIKTEKKQPVIHTVVGKVNQKEKEIKENTNTLLEAVGRKQIVKAYLKSTMSPSIKLSV